MFAVRCDAWAVSAMRIVAPHHADVRTFHIERLDWEIPYSRLRDREIPNSERVEIPDGEMEKEMAFLKTSRDALGRSEMSRDSLNTVIYRHLPVLIVIYRHLPTFAATYRHFHSFTVIYRHFPSSPAIYRQFGHIWGGDLGSFDAQTQPKMEV